MISYLIHYKIYSRALSKAGNCTTLNAYDITLCTQQKKPASLHLTCSRLELQDLSLSSDSALSAGQMSPTWDYQAIFEQSENSPNSDIPNSTQVNKLA